MRPVTGHPTWPALYDAPEDLTQIEQIPLEDRDLPATTYDALVRSAEHWPDRTAITVMPDAEHWQQAVSRTYAGLLADVHRVANVFHRLGVRREDTVALICPNCDQLVTATLAAELAGVAAPVNSALSQEQVQRLLGVTGARVVVVASRELDAASWEHGAALARSGAVDAVVVLGPTGGATAPADAARPADVGDTVRVIDLAAEAARASADRFDGEPPRGDDLASVFHTGGTTGDPKLAAHTHRNEVVDAWSVAANTALDEDASIFAALPLFHVNALVVTLLAPILRGQRSVWAGPLGYRDPHLYGAFWKLVESHRISTMSAVPTVYAVLAGVPVDADISSMRFAIVGAAALPPGVRSAFEDNTGVTLVEGYGLTEATCASARGFAAHPRPGTVGQRLPYQQFKTVRIEDDGTWTDLPTGSSGTLVIKGPTVFPGYVTGRAPGGRLTVEGLGKLRDGWLDTGDLARVDEDGFIHLVGRAKDLIVRGGHNLDPAVVEEALLAHPVVTGAAAVGMPDLHSGEVPVAYVSVAEPVTDGDLSAWAADRVPEPAAAPKAVYVVDAIPMTSVGKIHKVPLRLDATRRAVLAALTAAGADDGIEDVRAELGEDGVVVTLVPRAGDGPRASDAEVTAALAGFALAWRVLQP
ncbi:acyl-CoA synthetase [Flexivirga meconopsidis]|uniref:acyl-CoA synthetase n=1 Tax=Flexivirga meconopsidis TaxID=2977121 RepID=UPI00223EEF7B|nr:acyl-CoA synthetase [Flexivirga meconopsidis]